ncbi:MAG: hypothetical protein Q4P78_00910 [Rothia sp. (in: high G+C Gram-positive bacteria)]|uniref:hypothetical protein n=1 Tax=Rothia sp. (in: high G+C Gram-positive bacteria) TaxID=1885016 RepID=UPI0026E0E15D|nr:hypothetical protein [Rothia sp. (in: high G+C Gram-positive bacteria)]MDO5749750.1 hypothetical protein [Rothia sp. (in: high G+C Gram-positive bacteria)]
MKHEMLSQGISQGAYAPEIKEEGTMFPHAIMKKTGAALAVSMLVLTACSSSPVQEVPQDIRSALESYGKESSDIEVAFNIEMKKCMDSKGKRFIPRDNSITFSGSDVINNGARIPSMEQAKYGYKSTYNDSLIESSESDINQEDYNPADDISYALSYGPKVAINSKSCAGDAYKKIYGSIENRLKYSSLINEMLHISQEYHITEDIMHLYQNNKEYPQCMATAGYPDISVFSQGPAVAEQKFGRYRAPGTPANAEERAMAQADYTCQESSGIVRKAEDIFYSKAGQWLKDHEALIMEIRDIEKVAKERAVQIINNQS